MPPTRRRCPRRRDVRAPSPSPSPASAPRPALPPPRLRRCGAAAQRLPRGLLLQAAVALAVLTVIHLSEHRGQPLLRVRHLRDAVSALGRVPRVAGPGAGPGPVPVRQGGQVVVVEIHPPHTLGAPRTAVHVGP